MNNNKEDMSLEELYPDLQIRVEPPLKGSPDHTRQRRDIVKKELVEHAFDLNVSRISRMTGVSRPQIYEDIDYVIEHSDLDPKSFGYQISHDFIEMMESFKELFKDKDVPLKKRIRAAKEYRQFSTDLYDVMDNFGIKEKVPEKQQVEHEGGMDVLLDRVREANQDE